MQKVIGEVQVAGILLGIPEEIYERTKDFSGIYWEKYRGYFNDRKTAYAFCLGEFHAYTPPKKNPEDFGIQKAPQFFAYIKEDNPS